MANLIEMGARLLDAWRVEVQLRRQARVKGYRGKLRWEDNLDEMREDRSFPEAARSAQSPSVPSGYRGPFLPR